MAELAGKRALVTGAANGIGREIAAVLVEQGASVMLVDIQDDLVAKEAAALGQPSIAADVTNSESVKAAVDAAVEAFGGLDILVPVAGVLDIHPLLTQPLDSWNRTLNVNVTGLLLCLQHAVPAMIAGGGGSVVCMSSIQGLRSAALVGAYGASKAAVISLTRTASVELRDSNIRINAVCPGFIDAPMAHRAVPVINEMVGTDITPMVMQAQGRLGTPREVAEVVAFLASDRASFVTGQVLAIDNGYSVRVG
jgi:NAD(P)-dependent dehydrogenase (short-subunit alcohol dehydrogenase family)